MKVGELHEQNLAGDALYANLIKQQFPLGAGYDLNSGMTHEMWYRELKLAMRWLATAVRAGDIKPPVSIGNDFTIRDKNGQNIGIPGQWNPSMKPKSAKPLAEHGRIVKGVNTTVDVGTNEIPRQARKFGFTVDKDGRPPTLSKKVKGKSTNVLYNLGLAESVQVTEAIQIWPIIAAAFTALAKKKGVQKAKAIMGEFIKRMPPGVGPEVYVDLFKYLIGGGAGGYIATQAHKNRKKEKEQVKENINAQSEIYVDMDGVLADFFGDWKKLVGKDWRQLKDIKPALQKIRDTEDFWLNLPVTSNAKNLLSLIKDIKGSYNILSSPLPDDPNSEPHKRQWIEKHLSFFPPKNVIITFDKAKYASQSDGTPNILIDDYGINIGKWEAAGGMGFKHKDHKFERTARNLKTLMKEDMSKSDIKSAHKKADKLKSKPKAKNNIAKWAKEKGMDPEGAIYAIAMNQQKKESYTRDQLPQIKNKNLKNLKHTIEKIQVKDIIPVQEERIMENFKRQVNRLASGKYNHIVVDCDNKVINGHHRLDALKMLNIKEIEVARLPWKIKAIVENFANGKNKVQEAFDNPYPITWEYLEPTGPSSAIGKVEDGSALDIHISEDPDGIYEIEFARGQSDKNMGRSGQGDEFRIFATVQTAMIEWWNQLDKASAKKITFYANKEDGNRSRLYKRFLKIWGDKSEWDIEVNGNVKPGLLAYSLTNPTSDEPKNDRKTFMQRIFGKKETVENFADGKKKGKSRPGRVKRSGASCNGSVTELRAKAKKASGEKAKMYHWCANMKSGRKK